MTSGKTNKVKGEELQCTHFYVRQGGEGMDIRVLAYTNQPCGHLWEEEWEGAGLLETYPSFLLGSTGCVFI